MRVRTGNPMFRHVSIPLSWVVFSFLACEAPVASGAADSSWAGKKIMTKRSGIKIGFTNDAGRRVDVATLDQLFYTVLNEKADWVKVRHGGVEGWFAKRDALLLDDAVTV